MKIQSDYTSQKDILGRRLLAQEILNGLLAYCKSYNDGLVFSLTGEWGSGKSTLLTYLKDELKNKDENLFKIIDFNPWMFSGEESIKEAFLTQFALNLKEKESTITDVSKKVYTLAKAFRWLKYVHPVAGMIQEGVENLVDTLSERDDISQVKKEIDAILTKKKEKIVILIDDLDRLMPEQIFEVFQIVSLVANFKNVIYILSFDRQIVIDCIEKKYPKKGEDYLEKIIQVDYELPPILDEKLDDLFKEKINELNEVHKFHFNDDRLRQLWSYHGLKAYFKTIRDFKRFFNSFQFRLGAIKNEINAVDFLAIEAIRVFDFTSYTKFFNFFKDNTRNWKEPEEGLTTEQFAEISVNAVKIIKSLSNVELPRQFQRYDWNDRRLLDKNYFDRYFSLLISSQDISEQEIISFLEVPTKRELILLNAVRQGQIKNFFSRLSVPSFQKNYGEYDYELVESLLNILNKNINTFAAFAYEISNLIINLLCGNKDVKSNIEKFFDSFGEGRFQTSFIHVYFFHFIRKFINGKDVFRPEYDLFDKYYKENYKTIEKNYLPIFKDGINFFLDYQLTANGPFIKFLYQINYAELASPTEYDSLLKTIFNDRQYLIYIAKQFTGLLNEGSSGRRDFSQKNIIFTDETFSKYLQKTNEIPDSILNNWDKKVKAAILQVGNEQP